MKKLVFGEPFLWIPFPTALRRMGGSGRGGPPPLRSLENMREGVRWVRDKMETGGRRSENNILKQNIGGVPSPREAGGGGEVGVGIAPFHFFAAWGECGSGRGGCRGFSSWGLAEGKDCEYESFSTQNQCQMWLVVGETSWSDLKESPKAWAFLVQTCLC